jgi:hypothetical protein
MPEGVCARGELAPTKASYERTKIIESKGRAVFCDEAGALAAG